MEGKPMGYDPNFLRRFTRALEYLTEYDEIMPVRYAMIFLVVAQHHKQDGISGAEISRQYNWPQPVVSRALRVMEVTNKGPNYDRALIVQRTDPAHRRANRAFLTPAGERLLAKINEALYQVR